MEYKDLILLIDRMDQSTLTYLDYQTDTNHVILSKETPQLNNSSETAISSTKKEPNEIVDKAEGIEIQSFNPPAQENAEPVEEGELVESPMIGVAYLQANPDEDVYVSVGDRVEQGDTVCIIEAMKIMNEIQAPVSGTVTEILVENEEVVEFNQPLIRIKP